MISLNIYKVTATHGNSDNVTVTTLLLFLKVSALKDNGLIYSEI